MKTEQHKRIANAVIKMMDEHGSNWIKPWVTKGINDPNTPISMSSGKPYRGINWIALGMARYANGYASGQWATYKQWQARDAQVRQGEKAELVVLYKPIKITDKETGDDKNIRLSRGFNVFNADQVDGYNPPEPTATDKPSIAPDTAADTLAANVGAVVKNIDKFQAFFVPSKDFINLPDFGQFKDATNYASTLCHELTHWTGHKNRLDRNLKNGFKSKEYAAEELIAELGSAMLMGSLGFEITPREDHAKYLNGWMQHLKDQPKAIFTAAAKAQAAADWLINAQDKQTTS